MFLYLMDGCYGWWKEIMQNSGASSSMEKGKESKAIALLKNKKRETSWLQENAQENEFFFLFGGRKVSVWNPESHHCSLSALSSTLHSTWSSPQCRPWPCCCFLRTPRAGILWKQYLGNDLLWSSRDNFSSIKENTSLQNLTLFFSDLFFFPQCF